jgi:hypothetical protein
VQLSIYSEYLFGALIVRVRDDFSSAAGVASAASTPSCTSTARCTRLGFDAGFCEAGLLPL